MNHHRQIRVLKGYEGYTVVGVGKIDPVLDNGRDVNAQGAFWNTQFVDLIAANRLDYFIPDLHGVNTGYNCMVAHSSVGNIRIWIIIHQHSINEESISWPEDVYVQMG
jgi:hypothetical protein